MIGIDTNVLLRLLLDDDAAQSRRIDALLAAHGTQAGAVHVADAVLAETLWTLVSVYQQPKPALVEALTSLLHEPVFGFEDRAAVATALAAFEHATCGFSDCLIAAKNSAWGCEFTASFDKRMRRLQGVRVL